MRIFNKDKTSELYDVDYSKGYTKEDKLITHLPAVESVEEQGHYVVIKEYENGGKDVEWVVDVQGVKAQPEREKIEDILIYIPYTAEELNQIEYRKEYNDLINWFNTYYTIHEQKYQRMIRLNDTTENWVEKLQQLDSEAEIKRARIQELEK